MALLDLCQLLFLLLITFLNLLQTVHEFFQLLPPLWESWRPNIIPDSSGRFASSNPLYPKSIACQMGSTLATIIQVFSINLDLKLSLHFPMIDTSPCDIGHPPLGDSSTIGYRWLWTLLKTVPLDHVDGSMIDVMFILMIMVIFFVVVTLSDGSIVDFILWRWQFDSFANEVVLEHYLGFLLIF